MGKTNWTSHEFPADFGFTKSAPQKGETRKPRSHPMQDDDEYGDNTYLDKQSKQIARAKGGRSKKGYDLGGPALTGPPPNAPGGPPPVAGPAIPPPGPMMGGPMGPMGGLPGGGAIPVQKAAQMARAAGALGALIGKHIGHRQGQMHGRGRIAPPQGMADGGPFDSMGGGNIAPMPQRPFQPAWPAGGQVEPPERPFGQIGQDPDRAQDFAERFRGIQDHMNDLRQQSGRPPFSFAPTPTPWSPVGTAAAGGGNIAPMPVRPPPALGAGAPQNPPMPPAPGLGGRGMAKGGHADKKWIQKAVPKSHKGRLHRALGVPEGEPIPASKLASAERSGNEHVRRMAQFAKNVKK